MFPAAAEGTEYCDPVFHAAEWAGQSAGLPACAPWRSPSALLSLLPWAEHLMPVIHSFWKDPGGLGPGQAAAAPSAAPCRRLASRPRGRQARAEAGNGPPGHSTVSTCHSRPGTRAPTPVSRPVSPPSPHRPSRSRSGQQGGKRQAGAPAPRLSGASGSLGPSPGKADRWPQSPLACPSSGLLGTLAGSLGSAHVPECSLAGG